MPDFVKAGVDIVCVHCKQSSTIHLHRTLNQVTLSFTWILKHEANQGLVRLRPTQVCPIVLKYKHV